MLVAQRTHSFAQPTNHGGTSLWPKLPGAVLSSYSSTPAVSSTWRCLLHPGALTPLILLENKDSGHTDTAVMTSFQTWATLHQKFLAALSGSCNFAAPSEVSSSVFWNSVHQVSTPWWLLETHSVWESQIQSRSVRAHLDRGHWQLRKGSSLSLLLAVNW